MGIRKSPDGPNYFDPNKPVTNEQIREHIGLAESVAAKMIGKLPKEMEWDEVRQYALIGLVDAIQRHDPSTGNAFSTYAVIRIRGAVIDMVRREMKVPREAAQSAGVIYTFYVREGYYPSFKELKKKYGWERGKCAAAYSAFAVLNAKSVEQLGNGSRQRVGRGGLEREKEPFQIPAPWQYEPDSYTELRMPHWFSNVAKEIDTRIDDARLRAVLKLRILGWGLDSIAELLGVTDARATQLVRKAVESMGGGMEWKDVKGSTVGKKNRALPPVLYVEGEINSRGYASLDE